MQSASRRPRLNEAEERSRASLDTVIRMLGLTNSQVAEAVGCTYQSIQQYRNGSTRLRDNHLQDLARALDIPRHVLDLDVIEAGMWLLNNRSEQVIAATGWLSEIAAHAA